MAVLTFVVAVRMFRMRIAQIKREKIRLQSVATSKEAVENSLTAAAPTTSAICSNCPCCFIWESSSPRRPGR